MTPAERDDLFKQSMSTPDDAERERLRKQIAAEDTESPIGLFCLAWLLSCGNAPNPERALKLYSEVLALEPNFWHAHFERGNLNFDLGNFKEAISDYESVGRLGFMVPNVLFNLALANQRAGRVREALSLFNETLALEPTHAEAHYAIAGMHIAAHAYEQALPELDRAIEIQPANAGFHLTRGLARANLRDYKGALDDLDMTLSLDPSEHAAYVYRGNVHLITGDTDSAVADFAQNATLSPKDWTAFEFVAVLLAQEGAMAQARWCAEKAVAINPGNDRMKAMLKEKPIRDAEPAEPDWKALIARRKKQDAGH